MKDNIPAAAAAQLRRVLTGKDEVITLTLAALLAGGHILLEDQPGTGKTTLALAVSKVFGIDHRRIQLTPDTVASDITGYAAYDRRSEEFRYHPGAAMTNLLLADELNRTSGKTQAALLEAMEEGSVTVDGITRELPQPFCVIATQNPVGQTGTNELPLSQLDRFMIRLRPGFPDKQALRKILTDRASSDPLDSVTPVCDGETLKSVISDCSGIFVSDSVYDYVCELTDRVNRSESIRQPISPRGALQLCKAARAGAYLDGRDHVVPADIRACLLPVCAHRIVLDPSARLSGETAEGLLRKVMKETKSPDDRRSGR
ncbi:MAG: MoxR family ATPase [Ruminococcus sp.]|nr:MoxR family ATPase [Ruminococcus sp.]